MHSWARWAVISVILALSASVAPPARAAFGDCATREYWTQFDAQYGGTGPTALEFACVERLRITIPTASGERTLRIIHHPDADWIADGSTMAEFDRGARLAAAAIARLGDVQLEDITILLADDFPPRDGEVFSDIAGQAEFRNDDGECHVIFFLAGPASDTAYAASIVAHELFHCVQVANLTTAQVTSGANGTGAGGDWWLEGSASWFAALAVPDPGTMPEEVAEFDRFSPTTPLNRQAYSAAPFFLWLGAELGPEGMLPFLRNMAGSNAEAAQRAAMAAALPQERWLDFAEAYLDGAIRYPDGRPLGSSPQAGDAWDWSATRTQRLVLEPFVLARATATFQCGRWRASVAPASAHSARPESGGGWAPLPEEIDANAASGGARYRFAAMSAAPSRVTMNIVGTKESGCGDCAGVRTTDACLVGAWRLTGGGAAEWMRRQGVPGSYSTSGEGITFHSDGTFITGVVAGEMHVEGRDSRGDGDASAQAGGRWSTSGGVLNMCADMQAFGGQVTVTSRSGSVTRPLPGAPPATSSERYTCEGSRLDTERDIPRSPPMQFHYTRVGGG